MMMIIKKIFEWEERVKFGQSRRCIVLIIALVVFFVPNEAHLDNCHDDDDHNLKSDDDDYVELEKARDE